MLGDTLVKAPEIIYPITKVDPVLKLEKKDYMFYYVSPFSKKGKILFTGPSDSAIKYSILQKEDAAPIVLNGFYKHLYNIEPGNYQLILVTSSMGTYVSQKITVKVSSTTCLKLDSFNYRRNHPLVENLLNEKSSLHYNLNEKIVVETILKQKLIIVLKLIKKCLFFKF